MLEITFVSFVLGFPCILPKRVPRRLMLMTLCLIILCILKVIKWLMRGELASFTEDYGIAMV